jgi:DNA polymerase elongation subunit (family B)
MNTAKNNRFYTSIAKSGQNILVREVVDGIHSLRKDIWSPTYYLKDASNNSGLKTLYGDSVKAVKPGNMYEAREWCKQYTGISGVEVFGQQNEILQYANEYQFTGWDFKHIKAYSIDIETGSADGNFPDPKYALGEVQLITLQDMHTKRCYTWGTKKYTPTGKHKVETAYTQCSDEKTLLKMFLIFWEQKQPDVITGWNCDGFDMPYLVNRLNIILGPDFTKKLSPWGQVDFKLRMFQGREECEYSIVGVSVLDMMLLMKKFTTNARESWSLGSVAQEELGTTKLENPEESFDAFYRNAFDEFVEYNIVDTELVSKINDKLKLIQLACTMAYEARINYTDVYSPVKTWDAIMHNQLLSMGIVTPPRKSSGITSQIEGAYVKTPVPGMYRQIISFDFSSLYPSIMRALNLSPETYLGQTESTVESCLAGTYPKTDSEVCIAPNGSMYSKKSLGIIPLVIKLYMTKRRDAKNLMLDIERQIEQLKTTTNDKKEIFILSQRYSELNNIQTAYKLNLNSLYGSLANAGFRYFNPDIAESITLTGQLLLRTLEARFDKEFSDVMKIDCTGTMFYADTDSAIMTLDKVVKKYAPNNTVEQNIKLIEKLANDKMSPVITKITQDIATKLNVYENTFNMKLEMAASHLVQLGKKKYFARVYSSEGVSYAKPKLKIMGMEIIKSSTPKVIQKALKDSIEIILDSTESEMQEYIAKVKADFVNLTVEQIAFPRGLSNLAEYSDPNTIFGKKTPIHVRAALLYNHLLEKNGLTKKYEILKEGNKLKFIYLAEPNPLHQNIIGWPVDNKLPTEFGLHKYIDVDLQFEKVFLNAVQLMIEPMNWKAEHRNDLSEFF